MKVVHAGDLHVWRIGIPLCDLFAVKRWLGTANLILRRAALFPPAYRELMRNAIADQEPDLLLFTGDFTQSSLAGEFKECAQLFSPLQQQLGGRCIALPGNHDVYTHTAVRKRWREQHLPWVQSIPVVRHDLSPALSLVAVDHSEPFRLRSNGRVSPETHERLRQVLTQCRHEQRTVILMGHYPYVTPPEHPESPEHKLLGDEQLLALVREFAPALYVHGHKHVRWALRHAETPDTLCLNCGSLGMKSPLPEKQAGFLSWEQEEDGQVRNLTSHVLGDTGSMRSQPLSIQNVSA